MNLKTLSPVRRAALVLVSLLLPSVVGVILVAARFGASRQTAYFNLVWNLFLAWLPLIFALLVYRFRASRGIGFLFGLLWLLFLPNSPYLVTDLVHLRPRPPVPLWFDILTVQLFVLTGLALGFVSLHLMHRLVSVSRGRRAGWLFTGMILGLTAFGVYLGRFERWNSWDLFVSPIALGSDIANLVLNPGAHRTAVVFSVLCTGLLALAYLPFHLLTTMNRMTFPKLPRSGADRSARPIAESPAT